MSELKVDSLVVKKDDFIGNYAFEVPLGSYLSVIGASGSGKSTLLEALAGFLEAKSGSISYDNKYIHKLDFKQRKIGFVFQANSLFSHLTVKANLLLALHDSKSNKSEKLEKVLDAMAQVKISETFLERFPSQISGGELARLNVARTLLRDINILLLDEPFASLDEELRMEMNFLMHSIHQERKLTTICVTHFQEDAFMFSDKILFIDNGVSTSAIAPQKLMENPPNQNIAKFLRTGNIYQLESQKIAFILPNQLKTEPIPNAIKQIRINIENYKQINYGENCTVIDLNNKKFYKFTSSEKFNGSLYFDEAAVTILEC